MTEYRMTIGGCAVRGERFFPVIDPATGQPFAEAPECTTGQLDRAMDAARRAAGAWRQDERARR
jgi:acyl-CoA reductase-like NAD-dependent aldehyde dehydrogenase